MSNSTNGSKQHNFGDEHQYYNFVFDLWCLVVNPIFTLEDAIVAVKDFNLYTVLSAKVFKILFVL